MKRFIILSFLCLIGLTSISQNTDFSNYSFVVIPENFEFTSSADQYQLNSMTEFYLNKIGFNTFFASKAPNTNRCDGLYANVEDHSNIFTTKLQVVLRDCNNQEVFRSELGKSKYKDYDKTYPDALRKAFASLETLKVNQKDLVIIENTKTSTSKEVNETLTVNKSLVSDASGTLLPTSKFLNYSKGDKSMLLRKTAEGYSLYEESASVDSGLLLLGKIVVIGEVVKYLDVSGKVFDAAFDTEGNLTIKNSTSETVYHLVD